MEQDIRGIILMSCWEKDAFNALMQKAADDMLQLAKVMEEVDDIQATYKKLMWANCNACHSRYRKPH